MNEEKKQQVIALGRLGWSLRRIEEATGVRRETTSNYLKEAGVALRPPRGRRVHSKPASPEKVTTDFGAESGGVTAPAPAQQPGRSPSASACEPYREVIELALSRRRNAMTIWQELVDTSGFAAEYKSVNRFVRKLRGSQSPEACAVIETAPGEELQVDYGTGPMVRDPHSGKYRRTRLFVLTLGYSRKSVRLLVLRSSSQIWAELHEKAFRRLGGCTRVVVLDNLREGVLAPDIYDPLLNPLYRDVLQHYGTVPLPCRVGHPDRKGKVKSGVAHAQKTPLKGLRFESLEEAQTYLDQWEARWADTRIHGTTKRQVAAMFDEERPSLLPLPLEPFRYYQYGERTVHLDGCVEVEAAYYSAPPGWISRRVQVQWDSQVVRLLNPDNGQLLREHLRQARPPSNPRGRPPQENANGHAPVADSRWQNRIADSSALPCDAQPARRDCGAPDSGVLSLAKKYGAATVDDACAAALEMGVCDYHFVRRYLERNPQLPLSLRQIDPLIRQLTLYRDFIENKTKESEL